MRTTPRFFGFFVVSLRCLPAVLAQTDPPPPDPHEMVKRQPHVLSSPTDRADAFDLLARPRKNLDLHSIAVPYRLKVSFESQGATLFEGAGTMEEVYDGQPNVASESCQSEARTLESSYAENVTTWSERFEQTLGEKNFASFEHC
jgi:hypothetical protein